MVKKNYIKPTQSNLIQLNNIHIRFLYNKCEDKIKTQTLNIIYICYIRKKKSMGLKISPNEMGKHRKFVY